MELNLAYKFSEAAVDQEKRTAVIAFLEEDILSENGRFYPAKVVREAVGKTAGKRALIGHDTNNPMDIVAKIEKTEMRGKLGVGYFRFGTDDISERMLTKIKDGLVDSVSIRASGESRQAKIGDEYVDVIEKLDIYSVDLVVEGGVKSAKVLKVFESAPTLNFENNKEKEMAEIDDLKKKMEEQDKQLKKLQEDNEKKDQDLKESKEKEKKAALEAYKSKKLATIKDKEDQDFIGETLSGSTEKEIDEKFDKAVAMLKKLNERKGVKDDLIINPSDSKDEVAPKNANEFLESSKVSKDDKLAALRQAMGIKEKE